MIDSHFNGEALRESGVAFERLCEEEATRGFMPSYPSLRQRAGARIVCAAVNLISLESDRPQLRNTHTPFVSRLAELQSASAALGERRNSRLASPLFLCPAESAQTTAQRAEILNVNMSP